MGQLEPMPTQARALEDEDIRAIAVTDRRRALGLVVHKYRDRIYAHAHGILKDHHEALDVAQRVFVKAMREQRLFDAEFRIKAWLFRVTSNLCFNIVRDTRRRSGLLERQQRPTSIAAHQPDVVFADERQKRILAAMDELSEAHRKILMLRYYSDLSYAEIADALQIKLGTVMSRLSRAKARLVEVLDARGVEGL